MLVRYPRRKLLPLKINSVKSVFVKIYADTDPPALILFLVTVPSGLLCYRLWETLKCPLKHMLLSSCWLSGAHLLSKIWQQGNDYLSGSNGSLKFEAESVDKCSHPVCRMASLGWICLPAGLLWVSVSCNLRASTHHWFPDAEEECKCLSYNQKHEKIQIQN